MATESALVIACAFGGVLALLTGSRVRRAYSLTGATSLRWFSTGFFLLALSQFAAAALQLSVQTAPLALERSRLDHFDLLFWLHYLALLAGLMAVFRSFGRRPFRWAPAVAPVLLWAGPALQLVTIVVLFFVVLHSGLNHIARKGGGSIRVSLGFFFILLGHIGNLTDYAPLEPRLWWAELLTLLGFAVLFFAVASPRAGPDA